MTCSSCGSREAVAVRGETALCAGCAERRDWARIIDLVQSGVRSEATVDFVDDSAPLDPELAADPFG